MDIFLIHSLILIWTSIGSARRLNRSISDQLLSSALIGWANITVTCLVLSLCHKLGDSFGFFTTSTVLAVIVNLALLALKPSHPTQISDKAKEKLNSGLLVVFIVTLLPVSLALMGIAYTYAPNSAGSLSHDLPRALYYLGQNSLRHFDTADLRQIYFPFNNNLLQVFGSIYSPPWQCLNLFNLAAWGVTGLAVYRLCRLLSFQPNASLITSWLVLTAPPVVALATSTSQDLPAGAGLLCTLVFALKWKHSHLSRDAILSGLSAGLILGSSLNIISFGTISGLLFLVFAFQQRLHLKFSQYPKSIADWMVSAIIAITLAAPFIVQNLAGKARWAQPHAGWALERPTLDTTQEAWNLFSPLPNTHSPLLSLDENSVGLGLTGLLFLLSAFLVITRYRNSRKFTFWLTWLSLSWFCVILGLKEWLFIGTGAIVPSLLMLSPCVAMAIEFISNSRHLKRYAGHLLLVIVSLTTLWGTSVYLLKNTSRPLRPLLDDAFYPPPLPTLPLLVVHHLSNQPLVNIDSDGVNEKIFPFLAQGENQRFTSNKQVKANAYNILSRSNFSRNAPYHDIGRLPSYVLIPIPSKQTAGVEFLATYGNSDIARDYFGIIPHADQSPPIDSNRNLLISIYKEPEIEIKTTRISVAGLNFEDSIQLKVESEHDDGSITHLADISSSGEVTITIPEPFNRLFFRALHTTTGEEVGLGAVPYFPQTNQYAKPIDPNTPTRASSIFVSDLVVSQNRMGITSEGLLPTEGPFPKWDIPFIRWAKQPTVRIAIPADEHLTQLELSFSLRLHVRPKAGMSVFFNGKLIAEYRMEGQKTWLDQTLLLTPRTGENLLEFRDSILKDEPDWREYLDRYPDVEKYLLSEKIPLEQGARNHFNTDGRTEGRTMQTRDIQPVAPDSYYFMFRNIRIEGFMGDDI